MPRAKPLRERQAERVRVGILEAVMSELDRQPSVEDVSMADVATAAGISLRTLYRYFADRPSLLRAAGEHLYGSLGVPVEIAGPDDISTSLLDAASRLAAHPGLARALVRSSVGQAARSGVRARRVGAIAEALKPLVEGLEHHEALRATAVISHLCSAAAWVAVADESRLEDSEAQLAVAWAIDALVAGLRGAQDSSRGSGGRGRSS